MYSVMLQMLPHPPHPLQHTITIDCTVEFGLQSFVKK